MHERPRWDDTFHIALTSNGRCEAAGHSYGAGGCQHLAVSALVLIDALEGGHHAGEQGGHDAGDVDERTLVERNELNECKIKMLIGSTANVQCRDTVSVYLKHTRTIQSKTKTI